jgi:hypothetical protein
LADTGLLGPSRNPANAQVTPQIREDTIMTASSTDARYALARAAVALAATAYIEGDRKALTETVAVTARDGVLPEALVAAVEAYVGTLQTLIGPEKAAATVARALETAELDVKLATSPNETGDHHE